MGALLSVTLVLIVSLALSAIFEFGSTLGETYGPLAGFVALLLWTLLTSIALLYGVALAAQLESVRAGVPAPKRAAATDAEAPVRADLPVPAAS